jgi:hypothetical protein
MFNRTGRRYFMKPVTESFIVSFTNSTGKEEDSVLIVGQKQMNQMAAIKQAYQGKEAVDIYEKLKGEKAE